ncbi:MAG TPA: S8 family serine peptidase [Polyangiaceae bacterium]|jgi:subtilisin family serine protease|nr:S8 family serine peptidase [Polyangiaceae bacterium]
MAEHWDKFDPELIHALEVWRVRSASGQEPKDRQITVKVQHQGDLEALEQAGLRGGYEVNGRVAGQIAFADLGRLATLPGLTRVTMQPNVRKGLDESIPETRVPWKLASGFPGKGHGVIIAVIDTGIDIFHESFRLPGNKTRILELWDQTATVGGLPPPTGTLGRLYKKEHIEPALVAGPAATPAFGSIDTNGHGTHVAGIAAGNGSQDDRCSNPGKYVGVAPEADLVIVKAIDVPISDVDAALRWCAQAGARNGGKPVVINCSWGALLGAHDGHDFDDQIVDSILLPSGNGSAAPGLAIVVCAMNEGYGDTHESGRLESNTLPGSTATIAFEMPANSTAPDPINIWYDSIGSFTVTVTAPASTAFPGTRTTGPFAPGGAGSPFTIGGMQVSITSDTASHTDHPNKKLISISISTGPGMAMRDGTWTLTLTNTSNAANYDIWGDSNFTEGYPIFRLSSESGDPPARRRDNTVAAPAMARTSIAVANYHGNEIYKTSSRGPVAFPAGTPSGELKPTIAGVGVDVTAPRSRQRPNPPSSCCDQQVLDMTGTSMASPHVAGIVALMFEKNRTLTFEQVRAHLQHSARSDGIPAGEALALVDPLAGISWSNIWGSGKVNAQMALAEMPPAPGGGGGSGGGGGGGGTISRDEIAFGQAADAQPPYTPHTIFSRLGDWHRRIGPRPGLMLIASLVSEHVDEILRLINKNHKVGAVWRRNGGPLLVRHLLYATRSELTLLPAAVPGCDVRALIPRFLPILRRFGSVRLKADIERFAEFAKIWPGAAVAVLDEHALQLTSTPGLTLTPSVTVKS